MAGKIRFRFGLPRNPASGSTSNAVFIPFSNLLRLLAALMEELFNSSHTVAPPRSNTMQPHMLSRASFSP